MKKVVIITPALFTGGAEIMAVRLAINIDKKEYDVQMLCLNEKNNTSLEKMLEENKIPVHYLGKSNGVSIKVILKTYKMLSKLSPDIIHSHITGTVYAFLWVLLHKCKLIHTIHTRPDAEFSAKFRKILKLFVKFKKIILVAVSKENQRIAIEHYKVGEDRCYFVNNPVEVSKYYKNKNTTGLITFINVSRQDDNKNQALALRAFAKLYEKNSNTRLVLVGDGNQHSNLISEVEKLGLQDVVYLPGEVSNAEDYLANADIYLSTSHREGLPLSMLEAMAAGLPIISSNVGGCSDIVVNNGILFEDNNEEQLLAAMEKLANDESLRNEYTKKGYAIVNEYDASKCAEKYEKLYKKFGRGNKKC